MHIADNSKSSETFSSINAEYCNSSRAYSFKMEDLVRIGTKTNNS